MKSQTDYSISITPCPYCDDNKPDLCGHPTSNEYKRGLKRGVELGKKSIQESMPDKIIFNGKEVKLEELKKEI